MQNKEQSYLLFKYPVYKYPINEIRQIFDQISQLFPDLPTIAMPTDCALQTISQDELLQIKNMIDKLVIENSKNDINT